MIVLRKICKEYDYVHNNAIVGLVDIDLELAGPGLVFIVGDTCSGKSALLNCLSGAENFTSGQLFVNGVNVHKFKHSNRKKYLSKYFGMIFRDINLIDTFNVFENIKVGVSSCKSDKVVAKALKFIEMEDKINCDIASLSMCEKQKVAIARALVSAPEVVLADEPVGNLDSVSASLIYDLLREVSKKKLVIVTTRDLKAANIFGDRIIEIESGEIVKDENGISYPLEVLNVDVSGGVDFKNFLPLCKNISASCKFFSFLIVMLFAFCFASLSMFCYFENFDIAKAHASLMSENSETRVNLYNTSSDVDVSLLQNFYKGDLFVAKTLLDGEHALSSSFVNSNSYAYYGSGDFSFNFLVMSDLSVSGSMPIKNNEIVISKVLADSFISNGMYIDYDTEFFPESISDLIGQTLYYDGIFLEICGVRSDSVEKYKMLKDISLNSLEGGMLSLYETFDSTFKSSMYDVIVGEDFFSNFAGNDDLIVLHDDENVFFNEFSFDVDDVFYFDDDFVNNDLIADTNFVIVSLDFFNSLHDVLADFDNISTYSDLFEDEIFLNINGISKKFVIAGVSNENYINQNVVALHHYNSKVMYAYLFVNSDDLLEKIFNIYPLYGSDDLSITIFNDYILDTAVDFENYSLISKYCFLISFGISFLFIICFFYSGVCKNKKNISILKCMGADNFDVLKVYFVTIFKNLLYSLLICFLCVFIYVNYFNLFLFVDLSFFIYSIILSLIVLFIVLFIINLKISKFKSIDVMG